MPFLREFLLVAGLGTIVAGLTAYVMTFILVRAHLRDHHPDLRERIGANLFAPRALLWFLRAGNRERPADRGLFFLALPGVVAAWGMVGGALAVLASAALGQAGVGT
jgi:hypothetical protein